MSQHILNLTFKRSDTIMLLASLLFLFLSATAFHTLAHEKLPHLAITRGFYSIQNASLDTDPCASGSKTVCGVADKGPYCEQACGWNTTLNSCASVNNYPLPSNSSLISLVATSSPLNVSEILTIAWYGDSITWLGLYEAQISAAFASGLGTQSLKARLINQGVDGGTVKDLVRGYSPWGHLDPFQVQTNITLAETLERDRPDIVGIQIGINDVWQAGPSCGNRCSNVTEFIQVLSESVISVARSVGARVYLASVSTIGEKARGTNPLDEQVRVCSIVSSTPSVLCPSAQLQLDAFAAAAEALAQTQGVSFLNLREGG